MRKFLAMTLAVLLLVTALVGLFIWGGGYWENWPLLDRVSGPQRFKQYVADPIPQCVYGVHGGYSGFPQGRVLTWFQYKGNLGDCDFLDSWKEISLQESQAARRFNSGLKATKVFVPLDPSKSHGTELLIDENTRQGLLFID